MCISPQQLLHLAPALVLCIQLLTAPGWFITQVVTKSYSFSGVAIGSIPIHALRGILVRSFIHSLKTIVLTFRSVLQCCCSCKPAVFRLPFNAALPLP